MRFRMTLFAAMCLLASAVDGQEPGAKATFNELKVLVGDWKSGNPNSSTRVSFRLLANEFALVETWTMSPTRQSMTVYTLDGNRLVATHYCPQGNSPRLTYASTDGSGAHQFVFLDGLNLQDKAGSHEHAFSIRIESSGRLTRSETYIRNGAAYDPVTDKGEVESFVRLK